MAKNGEVVDVRAQHSIIYENSQSEIKDDTAQLIGVVKTGNGPLTRSEASFLLWYHAMQADKVQEVLNNGVVGACLSVLDSHCTAVEKTCAAGILQDLSNDESAREAIVRGRSANNSCAHVLHQLLHDARDNMRLYAARTLRLAAEEASARSGLLRAMENGLPYMGLYIDLLTDCREGTLVREVATLVRLLIEKREDLKGECIEKGMVEAILESLRVHKADSTVCALTGLLLLLAEDRVAWGKVNAKGGIELLIDLLGPPPSSIQQHEMSKYRHVLDPAWAAEQARLRAEAEAAARARAEAEAAEAAAAGDETGREMTTPRAGGAASKAAKAASVQRAKSAKRITTEADVAMEGDLSQPRVELTSRPGAGGGTDRRGTAGGAGSVSQRGGPSSGGAEGRDRGGSSGGIELPPPLPPPVDPSTLLSINKAALKWLSIVTMTTTANAAGCLYHMAQDPGHMALMSGRLAASRLVPLLHKAMEAEPAGGKKKGKKKGLSLSPEQLQALTFIVGCLKFLSLINSNKYRIAKLGAVKPLVALYQECSHTLLRRNAQVVLSNMALLAENGQLLLDSKLPEEFLVPVPMRLTKEEMDQLALEFPDANFKAAAAAAPPPGPQAPVGPAATSARK